MRFEQPEYLYLFWLLPLYIIFIVSANRRRQNKLDNFSSPEIQTSIINPIIKQKRKRKSFLFFLVLACLIFALCRPQWGFQWEDLKQKGLDIVVAMDVSSSMLAEDIKPNRLERAKRKVSDLIQMLMGDRIGLVAFAGVSFIQCPLTLDYSAANIFLDILDADLIPIPGTDLGEAIIKSLQAFKEEDNTSKVIIVITDGEDHGGKLNKASQKAKEMGVKIFAIGIGGDIGAPIPKRGESGFKIDKQGEVALTKLDENALQTVAIETGGAYVRSVTGDMDLKKIYLENIKEQLNDSELKSGRKKIWQDRFQWFLVVALALLTLESYQRNRINHRPS